MRSRAALAAGLVGCLLPQVSLAADLFSPIGPVMESQSSHFARAAALALVAIVPAILVLPPLLWRYRYGSTARYDPEWQFNKWFEAAIWGAPVLVVCALSVWLVQSTLRFDPYRPLGEDPLRIDLVGLKSRYLALYPEQGVAALDQIVIPLDRPVRIRLTTDTVMQSFLPNGFAGQVYAMPGMVTELNLAANREGEGTATQTQFSGDGFADMRVPMRAVTAGDFDAWLAGATGETLGAGDYPTLVATGDVDRAPLLRPLADGCLFDRIVARYHQNRAIPPEAQPGSPAYRPEQGALPDGDCAALGGAMTGGGQDG